MAWFKLGLAGVVAAFVFCASAAQDGIALADSGQVLLSGTLGGTTPEGTSALSARGYSVAGARVTVYLDPADGGHMAVGETADDVQVASAVTDPMGRYSLVTDPSGPAAAAAAAHGGYVNLVETVVTADNQMLITNFTAELVDGGWRTGDAATDPQPAPDAALVHAPAYPVTPRKGCAPQVRTTVLGTQKDWTTVGEVHTAGDMTNAYQYGYQGHAATHIGVAESGDDVSFSISGSHYEDNGATALWPAVGSGIGKRATTRFKYQHVRTVYVCLGRTVYSKESVQWNGDTAWGATNHTLDGHCSGTGRTARYLPHTTFIKDKGKGVTWSVGVTAFGVGLTTESDWSNNVRSTWHFGNNYPQYYLCGDTAGPVFAQRVFAGL